MRQLTACDLRFNSSAVTYRSSVLPPDLHNSLEVVGSRLEHGRTLGGELEKTVRLIAELSPQHVARADGEIAAAASLYRGSSSPHWTRFLLGQVSDEKRLAAVEGLEYLFLFHRDGRVREAALHKLQGSLSTPFLFAAVLWRLNDWVKPVRDAARLCVNRVLPGTDPAVIAEAATALLVQWRSWGRWDAERELVDHILVRPDVARELSALLTKRTNGPLASMLRQALRTSAIDRHLETMAAEAVQPIVRAIALDALLTGKATWRTGTEWKWIDKPMGVRKKVSVFSHRQLDVPVPKEELITRGIADRSVVVRCAALSGAMKHFKGTDRGREWANMVIEDRSPAVRERAEYILKSGE